MSYLPSSSSSSSWPLMSFAFMLSSSGWLAASTENMAEPLIRRLNAENLDPTMNPTRSPISSDCLVSFAGDATPNEPIDNPSTVDMGLINLNSAKNTIDLEGGDTVLDGDNARTFCESKFGAGSKPVTPINSDIYDAMVNLCHAKTEGNAACYLGLYREQYSSSGCDNWRGEDTSFSIASIDLDSDYGLGWYQNQPSCPWVATTDPLYDSSVVKHCVQYKPNPQKMFVNRCTSKMYLICTFHGTCTP